MNTQTPAQKQRNQSVLFTQIFIGALALLIVLAGITPRLLGFAPTVIAIIGYLSYRPIFGVWPRISRYAMFWAITISTLALISSLWAIEPTLAIERGYKNLTILGSGAILFSIANALPSAYLKSTKIILPACLILAGILALFELYFGGNIHQMLRPNAPEEATFNVSKLNRGLIVYALSLFIVIPLLLFNSQARTTKIKILSIIAIITALIIYRTDSQSAILSILIGSLILFLFPYKKKIAWYILVIGLLTTLAITPFLAQYLFQTMATDIGNISWLEQSYATARLEIWDFVSRYAINSPLYGHGIEATRVIEDFDTKMLYENEQMILHPHNFSVQIWIEFGVAGISIAGLFFSHLISQIYKSGRIFGKNSHHVYLPTLCATIAVSATGYGLWQGWWLGCFMLLLSLSTIAVRSLPSKSEQ